MPGRKLPIVAGMATMPTRAHSLPRALASILPQVDRLYLYLDKHETIPEIVASDGKIIPVQQTDYPGLQCDGKFLPLVIEHGEFLYLGPDDDIIYPPTYVADMQAAISRHETSRPGQRAIFGVHAVTLKQPFDRYLNSRDCINFAHALDHDTEVDILGTGTVFFPSRWLRFDPRIWKVKNVSDLSLALEAERQGVARIAVKRPQNYLLAIEEDQDDSIWRQIKADDLPKSLLAAELLKLKHRQALPRIDCRLD